MAEKLNVLLVALNSCSEPHYFSLALGNLKAHAAADAQVAAGTNIDIVDYCMTCSDPMQVAFYIAGAKPDAVGFSCYCWNIDIVRHIAEMVAKTTPEAKIIAGGPEVTPGAEEFLAVNPSFDIVVRGEGEETFRELLRALIDEEGLSGVAGISYREGEHVFANEDRPLIEDLDTIPSPYLTGILAPREHVTYFETLRGCPYRCAYCYEGKNYPKLRHFSDERVRAEIELIARTPHVTTFSFIDPVFNLTKERLAKLVEMLAPAVAAGKTIHTVEVITEQVDEETIELLKKAGAVSTETGPQTVNPQTVKDINRYFVRDKFVRGVELMRDAGLRVLCDLIVGLPGDDYFSFLNSVRFVLDLRPGTIIFSTLNVLPGTVVREEADKWGMIYDDAAPHYVLGTDTFSFEEIRKAELLAASIAREYDATS